MADNTAMPAPHGSLLVPHAAPASDACLDALAHSGLQLPLPHLEQLLPLVHCTAYPALPPGSFNSPAEHIQALTQGWSSAFSADGLLPFAAYAAQQCGLTTAAGHGWAFITPCHWDVHTQHVSMSAPELLQLRDDEGEALRQAMLPYFAEDGLNLHALPRSAADTDAPLQWLACGAALHQLPTASLAVAVGGAIVDYLPRQPQTRSLRRLQNEMQMLLYSHPVNDARPAHRAVNSFWISGTGDCAASPVPSNPTTIHSALQSADQQHDARAWHAAWLALDAELIAPLLARCRAGEAVDISLCGPHKALRLHRAAGESGPRQTLAQRLQRLLPWHTPQPQAVALLQSLL